MKKKHFALFITFLCLSCSASGSFPLSEKTDSVTTNSLPSLSTSDLFQSSESINRISEESSLVQSEERNPFSRAYDKEDGQFQGLLNRIAEWESTYRDEPTKKTVLRIYCEGEHKDRTFMTSDFPEIKIDSLEQYETLYGVALLATLPSDSSERYFMSAPFLLIDNPLVTYACPNGMEQGPGFIIPWTTEYYSAPEHDESAYADPVEEQSVFEKMGVDYDDPSTFPSVSADIKKDAPGYLLVGMKLSENHNGKVYQPSDFPEANVDRVYEFPAARYGRRYCVFRLSTQSFDASKEAIYGLARNSRIVDAKTYGEMAFGWQ